MLRISLRELLLLTLVVGLILGWWVDHTRNAAAARKLTIVERLLQETLNLYATHLGTRVELNSGDNEFCYVGEVR
jgi:hypothetical protein